MEMLRKLSKEEFFALWDEAKSHPQKCFSAKSKDPRAYLGKDYGEDMFFIWNGATCCYDGEMLVMGLTLVCGTKEKPQFVSPRDFLQDYAFTDKNPQTGEVEPKGSAYRKALQELKQHIAALASRR